MSSLSDTAYFMGIQVLGAMTLGACVDYMFEKIAQQDAHMSDWRFPILLGEFGMQLLVDAWIADMFFAYMARRGEDVGRTFIGNAPFWIYFLGSQVGLATKAHTLIQYVKNLISSSGTPMLANVASGSAAGQTALGIAGPSATGSLVTPFSRENRSTSYSHQTQANDYKLPTYGE